MAKKRLKSPRARLFVALDLPEETRAEIVAWGGRELADPALRLVPPESLHVTLAFLGYTPEKEIERLGRVVAGLAAAAAEIRLGDPVGKPSGKHPRLFALPAESPAAVELQGELEDRLVEMRLYEPEKRPFWPHVTVARVKPEGKGGRRPRPLSKAPGRLPKALSRPVLCRRVTLYRSELKPSGAKYLPLAQVKLR
jgi:2'-5' RNA ligase